MTDDDRAHHRPSRMRAVVARVAPRTWWQRLAVLAVVCLLVTICLRAFVVQAYYVPSSSMSPTLHVGDRIAVSRFGGEPQRGDVVVFSDPGGWAEGADRPGSFKRLLSHLGLYPTGDHLVKRVIGVPGDVIVCCDDAGRIAVNGQPLDEPYLAAPPADQARPCHGPGIATCEWRAGPVPPHSVFVLGDNRYYSLDSTAHLCTEGETDCTRDPYVDDDLVVGRVWAVIWPIGRWHRLSVPSSFAAVPDPAGGEVAG